MLPPAKPQRCYSANQLIVLVSLYFTLVFNAPFLSRFWSIVLALPDHSGWFLAATPLLLLCILVLLFSLFSHCFLLKPLLILLTLASSLVFYGTSTYGVVFDYGMIQNTFQTDTAEAFAYLNFNSVCYFLVVGVLPALLIFKLNIVYLRGGKELLQRIKLVSVVFIIILFIGYFFYASFAAVGRNNPQLKKYIIPTQYVGSTVKYIKKTYFAKKRVFKTLDPAPTLVVSVQKKVIVLVVGETARAKNFSYNGYNKPTNKATEPYQLLSFERMYSCGTETAVSVPCLFSHQARADFDIQAAESEQNLLDLAKLAGVDVLWIDNNSSCKGVCDRVESIKIPRDPNHPLCDSEYCFDQVLLEPLQAKLARLSQQTTLIVIHLMGSHGPTYYRRYPADHRLFSPDCPRSDIQNCTPEQLTNTYDNTIAYTDVVLSQMIQQLVALPDDIDTSLLYVSDHGESLGESGVYLHGFPYAFAPDEQKHIPLLTWLPDQQDPNVTQCLATLAQSQEFSHDHIFHSVLGLVGIKTTSYDPSMDIFARCHFIN